MLNIIIIVLILLGLLVHRYLTTFYEQGRLPYSMGFTMFATVFWIIYSASFIWMFGIVGGIIVTLLCFFQILHVSILWIFSVPGLIQIYKNRDIPRLNPLIYGGFSYLILLIAILTVVNFFVSPYKSMLEIIGDDLWPSILVFIGIVVVGNIARVITLSKFLSAESEH